jgi:hypothetical protein
VKVLRSGHATAAEWRRKASCTKCGSKVELEVGDLRHVADARDGDAAVWACPECKQENWLTASFVPATLRHAMKAGAR